MTNSLLPEAETAVPVQVNTSDCFLCLCCRTSMSLKSIDWCLFDPQSSEYVTDYMDAMFLTFDR